MSFTEIQFPSDISYGATGGPSFLTDIVTTLSGYEQRNSKWSMARCKYTIGSGIKNQNQWETLLNFFRARKGKATGFRFKDWSDFKGINQPIKSLGSNQYQLIKNYISGDDVFERVIKKPVAGTVKLYQNGILKTSGWSINNTTGIITTTFTGTLTADFEFDVPVRFDTDQMDLSMDSYGAGSWNSIALIEIRL